MALATFSFGGYGLALAALALMVFGAIECPPYVSHPKHACPFCREEICILLFISGKAC